MADHRPGRRGRVSPTRVVEWANPYDHQGIRVSAPRRRGGLAMVWSHWDVAESSTPCAVGQGNIATLVVPVESAPVGAGSDWGCGNAGAVALC